ncbi:MAG: Smr/MutS family protein [Planctomycetota bacterium]
MASRRRRRRFHDRDDHGVDEPEGGDGSTWSHEVDLHGCTVDRAERRLREELTRCRAAGRSPVLVITGKGYGSPGGNGVLGPAVEAWLKGREGVALGVSGVRRMRTGGALEVTLTRRSGDPR